MHLIDWVIHGHDTKHTCRRFVLPSSDIAGFAISLDANTYQCTIRQHICMDMYVYVYVTPVRDIYSAFYIQFQKS